MLRFPQLYKITQNAEGFNTKVSHVCTWDPSERLVTPPMLGGST